MVTAEDILDGLAITGPLVDVLAVASFFRIEVHVREWPVTKVPAYVVRALEGRDHLVVNALIPEPVWRFKVAHELFHLLTHLHHDLLPGDRLPLSARPGSRTISVHRQANRFAAELLMPERFLLKEPTMPLRNLAAKYQVSTQAMLYRARQLGRCAYRDDGVACWIGTDFEALKPHQFRTYTGPIPHPPSLPAPPTPLTWWVAVLIAAVALLALLFSFVLF